MVSTRVTPNATPVPVEIVGSSTFGRFSKISPARTYNMYISQSGDAKENWLISVPGYQKIFTLSSNGFGRGLFNSTKGDFLLIVVGDSVYTLRLPLFTVSFIGTLNTNHGEVYIAENLAKQICIVDGSFAYIYNYGTNTFAVFSDSKTMSGELIPNYVEYHNTYFLFGNANTGADGSNWYIYATGTGTTITYTQTLAIQTKSDFARAVKRIPAHGNNVLVMGEVVSEIWTQIAGTQIYTRNPSINIDYGCVSVATIAEGDNYIVWLAQNQSEQPVIMYYDGANPTRISSDGIDYLLSTIQFPAQSTAMLYRVDGHLFYQLTFYNSADNLSLLYDFNTGKFFDISDQYSDYHPATNIVYFNGTQYFVSLNNSGFYEFNSNITYIYEGGTFPPPTNPDPSQVFDIQRIRVTPSIREANSTRFIANSLVLTLEQGQDTNYNGPQKIDYIVTEQSNTFPYDYIITEQGLYLVDEDSTELVNGLPAATYQPRIDLAISKDAGVSWGPYVPRGLHPQGYRKNILHWESMGVANDLCCKFRFWMTSRI